MPSSLYILQRPRHKRDVGALEPLGTRAEVLHVFASMNTGPDRSGSDVLFGPGIRVELRPNEDPILQLMIHVTEEELFAPLFQGCEGEIGRLGRAVRSHGWQLYDPMSDIPYPPIRDEDDEDDR
ncbi:MAG: hypothetical protein DWH97_02225 [Planctomycetota bacterium]|nr:MAG: hypothetical protein DWH97_02225 [Planctomycetota bacterium]RLS97035.1 MAG: hypothetical protein DWI12_00970 [Planctomycetota bacterium]